VKRLLPLAVTAALALGLVFGGCSLFESWFGTDEDEEGSGLIKAAAPTADPPPGYVLAGTTVHFTSATEGARVYLSSTGALPELDSKGDAIITGDITILAFARAPEGYEDSDEVSFEYRLKPESLINLTNLSASSGEGWTYSDGVLTIADGANVRVSGSTATDRIVMQGRAMVTLDGASIVLSGDTDASPLDLASGANLTLKLAGTNTLTASGSAAGIHAPEGRTLTITSAAGNGQTSGTLTARGGSADNSGAGIGGGRDEPGGNITITGGVVNATGGPKAAGIGGGEEGDGGVIVIAGGTVNATSGVQGAGIGGGSGSDNSGGTISITGGSVTAVSTYVGAGIGGGYAGSGGSISITGGMVTATGGAAGAWIGGGYQGAGGTIRINSPNGTSQGTATALEGYGVPAIGPGMAGGSGGEFNGVEGGWPGGGTYTWGN
jgi:hypothetical protein